MGNRDNKGRLIVPCIYDWCGEHSKTDWHLLRKNGLSGCVDKEGRSSFDYKKYNFGHIMSRDGSED